MLHLKKLMNKISDCFDKLKTPYFIMRLLTAFVIVIYYVNIFNENSFSSPEYCKSLNFLFCVIAVFCITAFLCLVKSDKIISIALVTVSFLYCFVIAYEAKEFYISLGLCAVLTAIVIFCPIDKCRFEIKKNVKWGIVAFSAVLMTLFVGITCILYYKSYLISCYDFGIFAQMFENMSKSGELVTTCERDELLSHFAVHFSPIFYLILPIYMLIPTPETLLVVQAVIVASGVIPVMLLCKLYKLSDITAAIFSICYLVYPGFVGGEFFYLHENCFLAPLILWFLYFCEKCKFIPMVVCATAILCVKEDAAVYVAVIALYYILSRKKHKYDITIFIYSIVCFFIIINFLSSYGEGVMSDRYSYYIYDDSGLFAVIKSTFLNPAYTIYQVFKQWKILFILQTMLPLMFLPLVIKKPQKLVLLIPYILVNLMTAYQFQYNIYYQYVFGSGSILIFLAISNYAELGKNRRKVLLSALLCSMVVFAGAFFFKIEYFKSYKSDTVLRETVSEALSLVPEDQSVSASTYFVPNLYKNSELYMLEHTAHLYETEYVVLDLRYATDKCTMDSFEPDEYDRIYYGEGIIAVFQKK